eukprot:375270-Pelagomonas_calceolata.AAC.12
MTNSENDMQCPDKVQEWKGRERNGKKKKGYIAVPKRAAWLNRTAHKARAQDAVRGAAPVILRDPETGGAGGMGPRDLCLDKFDVSNGGKNLIQEGNLMLAFGRRYGLIGRNGTGEGNVQGRANALASGGIMILP